MKIEDEQAFKRDLALTLWNRVVGGERVDEYQGRCEQVVEDVVERHRSDDTEGEA